jgi:Flp pilus assembly protein TadG
MRAKPRFPRRRGATIVETALVLGVFLTVVCGTLDLGLAAMRQNVLSDTARRVARGVAIRGAESTAPLGPQSATGLASDTSAVAGLLRPWLATMDPAETNFAVEWPDGGNRPGQRVRVTVSYEHRMLVPRLLGVGSRRLEASSVLLVAY